MKLVIAMISLKSESESFVWFKKIPSNVAPVYMYWGQLYVQSFAQLQAPIPFIPPHSYRLKMRESLSLGQKTLFPNWFYGIRLKFFS